MKGNVKFSVAGLVDADPANLRDRHPNSSYESFYKICISIPVMISFSLVFFMIFYISPRGESMQLYQKGIYSWNKDKLADHMTSLLFEYKVSPYYDSHIGNVDGFNLKHTDQDPMAAGDNGRSDASTSDADFEETIRSIYFYRQSYFRSDNLTPGTLAPVTFSREPPISENYCIETMWKSKENYIGNSFTDADDQPTCANDVFGTDVGLSFDSYKWEANQDYSCRLSTQACEVNCNLLQGHYSPEEGACYEMKVLDKLCVKVGLKYADNLPPSEAEVVSGVKVTGGCFVDNSVASYRTTPLEAMRDGSYQVVFNDIPVEVHAEQDPYTVFTSIDRTETADLSIFFWLSMLCLLAALVQIVVLGLYYQCFISDN